MMLRIWPPSKRCPMCYGNEIYLVRDVHFRDVDQEWGCSQCGTFWTEPNGVLASEMEETCPVIESET
jgi:hypothetical protein